METKQRVKPTDRQLEFQEWEFGLFVHFGLRTFYEGYVDFDKKPMSPTKFNPKKLDCEQWVRTAKEAGMKYAVLTAKHHDGFSNWPSKYTDFSVAQSPWKDGKGDIVQEFVSACHKNSIKPGLYYSPFDGASDFYNNKDAKAYDNYFINQITELLTNYGDIDILWFDGAGSEDHEYDWKRIIGAIRLLQPKILIFNMADPDFRWVGNEDGIAPIPCWNTVASVEFSVYAAESEKLTERLWLPAECDVQMRGNWFYSENDEHTVKSLEELMGIYYYSVGRGANLLLNIGPNREGLLPEKDEKRLIDFGREIKRRFNNPLTTIKECELQEEKWTFQAKYPQLVDHIIIQEDLSDGECIQKFRIRINTAKTGRVITIYKGINIGHKAIIRIPPVRVNAITLEVLKSDGKPNIKALSFHHVGNDCTKNV
ncbi:alpha-L-fucosidase [Sporosarcina sp. G11-34]|uniref:alpha-L-fucosidase n=1 Tax=Sporosarcina sp. G11-34 TaxID=2849605 RepID=UPI0022A93D0F|nr:alpha-L-fucosidase [Sporosarcina sp. G11-34]MCZ2258488.1 alpha-L-fucosidase [Sporosarcina sp. G11-34]